MDVHQISSDDHLSEPYAHPTDGDNRPTAIDGHQSDGDDHLSERELGSQAREGEQRPAMLEQWSACCRRRGIPDDHCHGPEALYLMTAVETALRRGSHTPHLGRAARSWGIRTASPGDAVAMLSCLREVLVGSDPDAPPPPQLHLVLDQLMLQAVDAASGTLHVAARTDPLTGCANRRALADDLRRAVSSARQSDLDLAVVAIDLDGLKKINDTHGHAAGDTALTALVSTIRSSLRESDSLYRVGGDEFVVMAPFTDAAGVRELMRRVEHAGGPSFSWGVSSVTSFGFGEHDDPQQLLQAADTDLYERRRARRHRAAFDARRRRTMAVVSVAATVAATVAGAGSLIAGTSRSTDSTNGLTSPATPGGSQVQPSRAGSLPTDGRLPGTGTGALVAGGDVAATAAVSPPDSSRSGATGLLFHFAAPMATGAPRAGTVVPGGLLGGLPGPAALAGSSQGNPVHSPTLPASTPSAPGGGSGAGSAGGASTSNAPGPVGARGAVDAARQRNPRGSASHGSQRAPDPRSPNQPTTVTTAAVFPTARDANATLMPTVHAQLAAPPARATATTMPTVQPAATIRVQFAYQAVQTTATVAAPAAGADAGQHAMIAHHLPWLIASAPGTPGSSPASR